MARRKLAVLLADDHAIVRAGVRQLLSTEYDAAVTEAGTAQDALNAARQAKFDLVLLDISMPGRSGIDIVRELRAAQRDTAILILSMHGEQQFAVRALRAGADGYLTKSSVSPELIKAVEQVLSGRRYVSEELAQQLATAVASGERESGTEALSPREFEVLRLIADGKSGKEIAAELSLSFKTISTYRTRLLEKLGMHSNAELARYAAREGVVQEAEDAV